VDKALVKQNVYKILRITIYNRTQKLNYVHSIFTQLNIVMMCHKGHTMSVGGLIVRHVLKPSSVP